jgi:hypothetical protein
VIEHLPSKHEALISTWNKERKERRKGRMGVRGRQVMKVVTDGGLVRIL